jgi:hypothetical protein
VRKKASGEAAQGEVPPGVSQAMLRELHLLTRDGQLNADARRKLKQIRHLIGLIRPAMEDVLARHLDPIIVDCGAGKSYLGFLLYEMVLGPAGRGRLVAIEQRPELVATAQERAARFAYDRLTFVAGAIATDDASRIHVLTALHACDIATDDAMILGITRGADHVAVVPCCQAEVCRQLEHAAVADAGVRELFARPWHRREFGSHLTNVIRATTLEACGYQVTVTELAGWEHTAKNELILARRVQRFDRGAQARLVALLERFAVEPALIRGLRARGLDPTTASGFTAPTATSP